MGVNINNDSLEGTAFERALKIYDGNTVTNTESKDWKDMQESVLGVLGNIGDTVTASASNAQTTKENNKLDTMVNKITEMIDKLDELANKRPSKDEYYLKIAEVVSLRGTCLRRRFGAIIVNNDEIVATGYVGAPRGRKNCCDIGYCWREAHNIPSGQMYEKCRSMHAEMNACVSAGRTRSIGGTMYLVGIENDGTYTDADCCSMCKRTIINAGINEVVFRTKTGDIRKILVQEWIDNDDSLVEHEGY